MLKISAANHPVGKVWLVTGKQFNMQIVVITFGSPPPASHHRNMTAAITECNSPGARLIELNHLWTHLTECSRFANAFALLLKPPRRSRV